MLLIIACMLWQRPNVQAQIALSLSMDSEDSIKQSGAGIDGFYWFQPGVKGKALGFDGLRTVVNIPAGKVPDLSGGFTVSAWMALEAYPWTTMALVDQESDQCAGYYLGISADGCPGLWTAIGDKWESCLSTNRLPLYEWNHLAGSWSPESGMRLYMNGREIAAFRTDGQLLTAQKQDVRLGRNHTPQPLYSGVHLPDMAVQKPKPTACSLDGLMDEIRIEAGALDAASIADRYNSEKPDAARPLNPPKLPAGPDRPAEFGAVYTRLRYTDAWEQNWRVGEFPDVLVRFDKAPYRLTLWRGTSYVPCWVTDNGIWYCNEFLETGENCRNGGAEPMADKQARFSHVRIIENSAARVVVHWRYAPIYTDYSLAHVNPDSGWGDWVDEYYTIYPDGVAVRKICVWSDFLFALPGSDPRQGGFREYHESIVINPPGTTPQDNIKADALTLANMKGQTVTYSWENGPPGKLDKTDRTYPDYLRNEKPSYKWRTWLADIPDPNIHLVNLKAQYSPFVIVPPDGAMVDSYTREIRPEYSIFPWWNHWPVAQIESGGRWAYATDRPSHSSLSHVYWAPYEQSPHGMTKIMLNGMTDGPATNLVPLAKSWIYPPAINPATGCKSIGYDQSQRAFIIDATGETISFTLQASEDTPVFNPCFVIKHWNSDSPAQISIDDKPVQAGKTFRQGIVRDFDGRQSMTTWMDLKSVEPVRVLIAGE